MSKIAISLGLLIISNLYANVPTFKTTSFETTPIPAGVDTTDDAAIWFHPHNAEKSIILGVSKNKLKHGGQSGLGVYSLIGEQLQYIKTGRLNNVDLKYNF